MQVNRSPVARYKPDISLGNILTLIGMLASLGVWGLRLEGRVDTQQQVVALEQKNNDLRFSFLENKVDQQKADIEKALASINGALQRIESKLDGKADKK